MEEEKWNLNQNHHVQVPAVNLRGCVSVPSKLVVVSFTFTSRIWYFQKRQGAKPSFCKISLVKDQGCKQKARFSWCAKLTFQGASKSYECFSKKIEATRITRGREHSDAAELLSTWYEAAHSLHPPWQSDSTRKPSRLLKLQLYPQLKRLKFGFLS